MTQRYTDLPYDKLRRPAPLIFAASNGPTAASSKRQMRLTSSSFPDIGDAASDASRPRSWAAVAVVTALAAIFFLDQGTGDAPVQHLYYLPIILSALNFGWPGGLAASLAAVVLYHLANHVLYASGRGETDILQVALFIAVGVVTARLVSDAERLRRLASTDDLTGLHNLRSFEARLAGLMHSARQTRSALSLLVFDVDRLKSLNDHYGHLAGAEAVRTVGKIVAAAIPAGAVACRYGGDEFVVVLPRCDAACAEEIGGRLRQSVNAAAPLLAGHALPAGTLSISIGVACRSFADPPAPVRALRTDAQEGEALFRAADDALYRAKASGRNRVCSA